VNDEHFTFHKVV